MYILLRTSSKHGKVTTSWPSENLYGIQTCNRQELHSMLRLFIAFTIFVKLIITNLSCIVILAYLQFLENNNTSASAMASHHSALKPKLSLAGNAVHIFDDQRIKYFQKL